jgi:hypothetical protein
MSKSYASLVRKILQLVNTSLILKIREISKSFGNLIRKDWKWNQESELKALNLIEKIIIKSKKETRHPNRKFD